MTPRILGLIMFGGAITGFVVTIAWQYRHELAAWLASHRMPPILIFGPPVMTFELTKNLTLDEYRMMTGLVDDLEIPADFADTAIRELRDQGYLA